MGSKRYPGKSFKEIKGKPTLQHLIDSLLNSFKKSSICVLTSQKEENNIIRRFCNSNKIECFSGDEENVASRFNNYLKSQTVDYFVRLNGDSPLFDTKQLNEEICKIKNSICVDKFISTVNGGFPKGNNFEIISKQLFCENYRRFSSKKHFEHVTKFFYENNFNIQTVVCEHNNIKNFNLCFDTKYDFENLTILFSALKKQHYKYSLAEKCELFREICL